MRARLCRLPLVIAIALAALLQVHCTPPKSNAARAVEAFSAARKKQEAGDIEGAIAERTFFPSSCAILAPKFVPSGGCPVPVILSEAKNL